MNPDGTLSPASAPKKRAKPAPGSEPKAPVKTKKEIIPHTVVSAPEKDTVGDLIEQLHKEPEPLPEEQPEKGRNAGEDRRKEIHYSEDDRFRARAAVVQDEQGAL